jgi:hypothetical protein
MYKLNKQIIMILNNNNKWVPAQRSDIDIQKYLTFNPDEYNKIIGFIGYEKRNRYLIFKTKNMTSYRDTGAICDQAGKAGILLKLNEIVGENKYTTENTKLKKDKNGNIISEAVGQDELCVLQEFILRFFHTIKKDNKSWFLTPEMAILYKLYTFFNKLN